MNETGNICDWMDCQFACYHRVERLNKRRYRCIPLQKQNFLHKCFKILMGYAIFLSNFVADLNFEKRMQFCSRSLFFLSLKSLCDPCTLFHMYAYYSECNADWKYMNEMFRLQCTASNVIEIPKATAKRNWKRDKQTHAFTHKETAQHIRIQAHTNSYMCVRECVCLWTRTHIWFICNTNIENLFVLCEHSTHIHARTTVCSVGGPSDNIHVYILCNERCTSVCESYNIHSATLQSWV